MFEVIYQNTQGQYQARTPEGAVKKHFHAFHLPIPPSTQNGGWKDVMVQPVGGYTKIVNPYTIPEFSLKYDKDAHSWIQK